MKRGNRFIMLVLVAATAAALLVYGNSGKAVADIPTISNTVTVTTTGALPSLTLSGQSTCWVDVRGTFTGLTVIAQGSANRGQNYTTDSSIGTISSAGFISDPLAAQHAPTNFRANVTGISTGSAVVSYGCSSAVASTGGAVSIASLPPISFATTQPVSIQGAVTINTSASPCQGVTTSLGFTGLTASAQAVTASGTTSIYLCSYHMYLTGTAATYAVTYGTGTTCATGTNYLDAGGGGQAEANVVMPFTGLSYNVIPPGNNLCVFVGGTTPNLSGYVTFIQQ